VLLAAKWGYFVALGVLTGGLLWKHAFVRPADLDDEAGAYCAEMYRRFDRIATAAAVVLLAGGLATLSTYVDVLGWSPSVGAFAGLLGASLLLVGASAGSDAPVATQFRRPLGLLALGSVLGLLGTTAGIEVALRGFEPAAAAVRLLHLLAFAVWIGGAVWNIFVAVPTGKRRPTTAVVRAAGEQLERFRWAVRLVFPTIVLTGAYQGVDALGRSPDVYLETTLGLAVLAKLGAIGLLVVIFLLCPMWRACSPIEGVCELEDLGAGGTTGGNTAHDSDGSTGSGNPEVAGDD
jgi:putative copper export protein